jgi:hypothetical protein
MGSLNVFELTDISAHPGDKKWRLVDPHGGHQFFQSARAVRELVREILDFTVRDQNKEK